MTIFLKSSEQFPLAGAELWPFAPREIGGAKRLRRAKRWIAETGRLMRKALTESRRRRVGVRALSRLNDRTLLDVGLTRPELPDYMPGRIQGWRTLEPWR